MNLGFLESYPPSFRMFQVLHRLGAAAAFGRGASCGRQQRGGTQAPWQMEDGGYLTIVNPEAKDARHLWIISPVIPSTVG